jgi:hypothetical protein
MTSSARHRILRFMLLLVLAWSVMVMTHELGHIVSGCCLGATLVDFDIRPWGLPYNVFSSDPHPLLILWGGPVLGVLTPLAVAMFFRTPAIWFVADFCLLANGIYLAIAWIAGDSHLDTTRILKHGGSPVLVAMFCLISVGAGYFRFRRDVIAVFSDANPDHRPH